MLNLFFKKLFTSAEEKVQLVAEEIKNQTSVPAVKLTCIEDESVTLTGSKFGGIAYWPKGKAYPVDAEGQKMQLLAQLNFSESNISGTELPEAGILQFFIPSHGTDYGLDLSDAAGGKNFKVIYHAEIDNSVKEEDVLALFEGTGQGNESTPVLESVALQLSETTDWMKISSAGFGKLFQSACSKIIGKTDSEDYQEVFDSLDFDKGIRHSPLFFRLIEKPSSHCLGYPSFCQEDIRLSKPEYSPEIFDRLLLQIDSCSTEDKVSFGDGGICQIFINSKDLKNKDFSKVLFNWDCY